MSRDRSGSVRSGATALVLPGLGGSGPGHWQTLWEARDPQLRRVEQDDWERPDPDCWARRLEEEVARSSEGVVLVAHSLACALVARWAAEGSHARVGAALLVAPADVERVGGLEVARGFAPLRLERLPFPSWVVGSRNDPCVAELRARWFAERWGATYIDAGEAGHINVHSGHGDWPDGEQVLRAILESTGPQPQFAMHGRAR